MALPWPLSFRSLYLDAAATEVEGQDAFLVIISSLKGNTYLKDKFINKNPDHVEIDV